MPSISIESIIKAAWSLHLAGALPHVPGVDAERLLRAGGLRPWLELALTTADARRLVADGMGAWSVASLLGIERSGDAILTFPEGEAEFIRVVDGLCEGSAGSLYALLWTEKSRFDAYGHERARAFLAPLASADQKVPAYAYVVLCLKALASANGVDLSAVRPADLTRWRTESVVATVGMAMKMTLPDGKRNVTAWDVQAVTDEGRWINFKATDPAMALTGARVVLSMQGASDVQPGYVADCRLADEGRLTAEPASPMAFSRKCTSACGRELEVGDAVMLNRNLLDVPRGSYGWVETIDGPIAGIKFDRIPGTIPCYGVTLEYVEVQRAAA